MKNYVEYFRNDRSELVDPAVAAQELIKVARLVKRRLEAKSLPVPDDAEEIIRLANLNDGQLETSMRQWPAKRDGLNRVRNELLTRCRELLASDVTQNRTQY